MIEVIDILAKMQKKVSIEELVFSKIRTKDYILSIPHGGTLILAKLRHKLNIGKSLLIGTDLFTEQLYDTSKGIVVISKLNPYLVNMNRFRDEQHNKKLPLHLQQDPLHGISLTGEEILREEYSASEKEMLLSLYDRYHTLLKEAIEEMKQELGFALMFDCHSMSSIGLKGTPDEGKERPDFVIGTANDKASHHKIISAFYEALKEEAQAYGMRVEKNRPYKGGFITQNYGKPDKKVNVIQLEVKKATYMYEGLRDDYRSCFAIKPEEMKRVKSIIATAFACAADKAKEIYS
ncbi:MAG TPA: hypothetical protein ENG42_03205 [Candidatus Aenigmarchaeota archaeon]|nr:MAG: hypothetical protein DRP03_01835 [Candidatus Aenigmarchaeota archaeon]HDD46459.1 hypothetical protein [Candidatus Aenigmarchaeota archaeon]